MKRRRDGCAVEVETIRAPGVIGRERCGSSRKRIRGFLFVARRHTIFFLGNWHSGGGRDGWRVWRGRGRCWQRDGLGDNRMFGHARGKDGKEDNQRER